MAHKSQIDQNRSGAAKRLLATMPSWLVSIMFHMVMLIILAVCMLPTVDADALRQLVISSDDESQEKKLDEIDNELIENLNIEITTDVIEVESNTPSEVAGLSPIDDVAAAAVSVELNEIGLEHAPHGDLLSRGGANMGNSLSGRGEKARKNMVIAGGGTLGSEKAVSAALQWLAEHQLSDGGWSFDHAESPSCRGKCGNPGNLTNARAAATGLALLPFLGAGQTHKTGKYQKTVRDGLFFLKKRINVKRNRGSFMEPGGLMYSHGIASIALCEAHAMTKDRHLIAPAQQAVNFIGHRFRSLYQV